MEKPGRSWKNQIWMILLRLIVTFVLAAFLLGAVLTVSAFIPRGAIEQQVRSSAEYLCRRDQFEEVISGISGSKIDRYADAILLGIAWQYDAEDPLRSVTASAYYHEDGKDESENLLRAVTEKLPANREYLRYWHGSLAVLRPLLVLLSLREIYFLNGFILLGLTAVLLVRLFRRKAWVPLAGVILSLTAAAVWFVPMSLEYTWVFLIVLIQLHLVLCRRFSGSLEKRAAFFLLSGIITNYMDFLTTELLTLLMPLLLLIWKDRDENSWFPSPKGTALQAAAWMGGYAGMWIGKWQLARVVLDAELHRSVGFHIWMRSSAAVSGSAGNQRWEAIVRNVRCLFPLEYGLIGTIVGAGAVLGIIYLCFIYHRNDIQRSLIFWYGLIGLVPFVRFLALGNHSYVHYFFTYRVLAATVFAVVLMLGEVVYRGKPHGSGRRRA